MASRVHFDCFEVDLDSGQLFKRGARVNLREKSFQVLASLLEHPGEVVTREELQRRLWRDDVFVDFDNNLNAALHACGKRLTTLPITRDLSRRCPGTGIGFWQSSRK